MTKQTFLITGPTSGIGKTTALELAKHGAVILLGRNPAKLAAVQNIIERQNQRAISILCDLSDLASIRQATQQILALPVPITGIVNNAAIFQLHPTKNTQGWDMTFATNHLGPFALTEALIPHLPDGANIVFIASAVEDPARKPAKASGFRGARYISAEASARGEWIPNGSKLPGADAYATSKQCTLATALEFAREFPRLRINAVEPGFNPATALGREAHPILRLFLKYAIAPFTPFIKYGSNSKRAARIITQVLLNNRNATGIYYDEKGHPMQGSPLVHDPDFTARVVAETRALLAGQLLRKTTSPNQSEKTNPTKAKPQRSLGNCHPN